MTKTTNSKHHATSTARTGSPTASATTLTSASATTSGVTPPPTHGAPAAPSEFVPHTGALKHRQRMPHGFLSVAAAVAEELRAAAATYADDFGKNAPRPDDLAVRVEASAAWAKELEPAATWLAYVKDESSRAWEAAAQQIYELAPAFAYAASRDATIAARYPRLVQLFALKKASARRAAITRARNRKAKQAAPTTVASPAPASGGAKTAA